MHLISTKKEEAYMSSYHQLSQEERYTITALLRSKLKQADIARELKRDPSTISRELKRNRKPYDNFYRAFDAQHYSTARRRRVRRGTHFREEQIQQVNTLIRDKWSPEQISNYLKKNGFFEISHETIYRHILRDKKTGGTLYKHLRIMPKLRRKRYNSRDSRGILPGKRHISARPQEVESRNTFGHWEGDTLMGRDLRHCVLTLVERKTGFAIIRKMESRKAPSVTAATLPVIRDRVYDFKTLTLDNGTEFHDYKEIEAHSLLTCYFATPYHSWERGSVENLNGLIRQYFPKGTCMREVTQEQCDQVAFQLNTRPRKRHGYKTPLEVYYENL
jgi:transposase, IS30 family